ncbi:hypothetical protein IQ07DRAFT_382564 [Pyrenochaeta sp. DS3sAY3a]|nr:hypothetical protein IQ07DRAFT_382564 [Pyrenochaeta sp. DS3sAY3a]
MQEDEQIGSTTTSIDAQSTHEDNQFSDVMDAASVLQSLQHNTHGHTSFAAIETRQQPNSSYPILSPVGQSSGLFPDFENRRQPSPNTSGTLEHASAWREANSATVSNDDERPSRFVADMRIGGERLGDLDIFKDYH